MDSLNNLNKDNKIINYIKNFIIKSKKDKKCFFILYTIIFLLIISFLLSIFYFNGKSLINQGDAYNQHIKAFIYIVKWLRSIIKNLIFNHKLEIPTFSFSLGMGNDIITTLHYYGLGDPLNLIGLLCPSSHLIYMFQFLIILRLYLSGISFSLYCFNKNRTDYYSVLAGTLIYVFSFYCVFSSLHHPFFVNVCIYFPLMLLGTDKIFKNEKPIIFILSVFISAMSNFYFFYMEVILEIFYCIYKVVLKYSYKDYKLIISYVCKFIIYSIIGVLLSAIIFLPVILVYLSGDRASINYSYLITYNWEFYRELLSSFVYYADSSNFTYLGYNSISLVAIFLLFKNKKYKKYKLAFLILTAMLCIPIFGAFLNGLSYIANRWVWGYSFLISYIMVLMFPTLINLKKNDLKPIILFVLVYLGICYLLNVYGYEKVLISFVLMILVIFFCFFFQINKNNMSSSVMILLIILSICINMNYYYSIRESSKVSDYLSLQLLKNKLSNNDSTILDLITDEEFLRKDGLGIDDNTSLNTSISSTNYYWSLSNSFIDEFLTELSINEYILYYYENLDQRTYLNALMSVNYLTLNTNYNLNYLPYGYEYIGYSNFTNMSYDTTQYNIYKNKYSLPLGYTYSTYIDSDYYDSLSSTEKQEALLQGVVIEDINKEKYKETDVNLIEENLNYTIECNSEYISQESNSFVVTEENQSITLKFEGLNNSETYLYITGLDYDSINPLDLYNDDESIDPNNLFNEDSWNNLSTYDQNLLKEQYKNWQKSTKINLKFNSYKKDELFTTKSMYFYNSLDARYNERTDFIVNTCYSEEGITSITITFPEVGIYSFDTLQVISQPMDNYEELINNLSGDTLENIEIDDELWYSTNSITGDITLEENKILCMSIPYSTGWTCYVDGEETEILKANTMFMAIELEAGYHEIEFRYSTPGMKIGLTASSIGFVLFTGTCIYHYRKPKKKLKHKNNNEIS